MKKIVLVCLCLSLFTASIFTQVTTTPVEPSFANSAVSQATAGIFETVTDNVSASGMIGLERTFFSAGYMPTLVSSGTTANMLSGFWGMALNDKVSFGIAGLYLMDANNSFSGSASTYNEMSPFAVRPVFTYGDFGFHYLISRGGTYNYSYTDSDNQSTYDGSIWTHEIGFAYDPGPWSISIPIGIKINENKSSVKISGTTTDNNSSTYAIYLNPEFSMPAQSLSGVFSEVEALNSLTIGAEVSFNVYGDSATTSQIYANTDFQWQIWDNKIDFAIQPEIGMNITTSTAPTTLSPYLSTAVGSLVRPTEWLELRAGIQYQLTWANTLNSNSSSGVFSSEFAVYSGLGFVFGEDFFMDLYLNTTSTTFTIIGIDSWGIQLTYMF